MFIKKKLFIVGILLFLCAYPSDAFSKFVFTKWDKEVVITKDGQEVRERIYATVKLSKNQYYKNWKYIFNKQEKVKILSASTNRGGKNFNFRNNELMFNFKNLFSGQTIIFDVRYKKYNQDVNKFMVSEFVSIPSWAGNVSSKIKVNVSSDLTVYSSHNNLTQNGNNFYWNGRINQKKPFQELFLLTPVEGAWKVKISGNAIGEENFREAKLSIPRYFKGGPYVVDDYSLTTNTPNKYRVKEKNRYYHFDFDNVNSRLLSASVSAVIKNGDNHNVNLTLNPTAFLKYESRHRNDYATIMNNIRSNPAYSGLQEYQAIVEWVNKFIKYDEATLGTDMTITEILKIKRGVCSHYSKLFVELSRYVGIPAFSVAGLAFNVEQNAFIDHSWNYVYIMGKWIPVDATWNIHSGKLPISHIYTFGTIDDVGVRFTSYGYKNMDTVKTNIRNEVEFLR